jgi:hypothetical protein
VSFCFLFIFMGSAEDFFIECEVSAVFWIKSEKFQSYLKNLKLLGSDEVFFKRCKVAEVF